MRFRIRIIRKITRPLLKYQTSSFGHTHRRFEDQLIHGAIYSCRPFGYYYEWQLTRDFVLKEQLLDSYDPMKLRVLLRAHHPAFHAYQTQHLQEEFEQAMTIISY